ncbi:MAG: MarR family transcriptional regulator [Pseudomonadota bacterium]
MSTSKANSTDPELVFAVLTEVHMLHHLSTSEFNKEQDHTLHMAHFAVLNRLHRYGDAQTPQQLADKMRVSRATMTNSLARLTEKGLINVLDNPSDKRSKLVFLTAEGRKARDGAIARVAPALEHYASSLGNDALEELLRLLRVLHQSMDPSEREAPGY